MGRVCNLYHVATLVQRDEQGFRRPQLERWEEKAALILGELVVPVVGRG